MLRAATGSSAYRAEKLAAYICTTEAAGGFCANFQGRLIFSEYLVEPVPSSRALPT
ncbi:hypothetical protein I552_4315 [Mycobacterium xenopi 3993]|nr:hypothetical protein I552_4315 [Mycobacterium xenopi 3993]